MLRLLSIGVCVLLGACVTADNFDAVSAATYCTSLATCDSEAFDATYDSPSDCHDAWRPRFSCYQEHCDTFDAKAASDCVASWPVRQVDCDADGPDVGACADAWSDCNMIALGACLLSSSSD